MALIVQNYEMPDKSYLSDAYLRIQSSMSYREDVEYIRPIDGTDHLETSWLNNIVAKATVYVWADEICRRNHTTPVHWFSVDFPYNLDSSENIYQQAYNLLKTKYANSKDC